MILAEIRRTSIYCSSQWEGLLADGLRVYIRYRAGILSMGYGPTPGEAIDNAFEIWRSRDQMAGAMKTESMLKLTGLKMEG